MSRIALAAALVAGLVTALPAAAQFQRPADAVKYRQAAFTVMGTHMGRLGAMAQGRVPFDAAAAQANADILVAMSRLPFTGFVDGTAEGTKSKPTIWTERAKFDAAAAKMVEEVGKLGAAARTGDLAQLRAAVGATGASCKACHDAYRND
jgi:cytochrome c556